MQLTACSVHLGQRVVRRGGESLRLTSTEAALLAYLAERAGQDVSRDELLREVWGYADGVASRTVDTTVRRLRAKIEADRSNPDHLQSVHGVGYRLVLPSTRLVGRAQELSTLRRLSRQGPVTVVGAGGIGKTALARELGLPLVEAVGCRTPEDVEALWPDHPALIDNLEQVDDLGALLTRRAAPGWVFTSRRPLGYAGEQLLRLEPLSMDHTVELLARCAPDDLGEDLRPLARWLDGLPLAIELAGARLDRLSADQLLARLQQDARPLRTPRPEAPHHGSLARTVEDSLASLDAPTVDALLALAVFAGPISHDVAERQVGTQRLDELVASSLLQVRDRQLCVLVPVRQVLADRIQDTHRGAHRRWLLELTDPAVEHLVEFREAIRHAEDPVDLIERACPLFLAQGPMAEGARLCLAALEHQERPQVLEFGSNFLRRAGQPDASRELLERLKRFPERAARAHRLMGQALFELERFAEAEAEFDAAEALGPDRRELAYILGNRANLLRFLGRLEDARRDYEASIAACLAEGDRRGAALCRGNLAVLYMDLGDLDAAQLTMERAIADHRALGRRNSEAVVMSNLGSIHYLRGDLTQARGWLQRAADQLAETGHTGQLADALGNLAEIDRVEGHIAQAVTRAEQALALEDDASTRGLLGELHVVQGLVRLGREELDQAADRLVDADLDLAKLWVRRARVASRLGERAADWADQAREVAERLELGPHSDLVRDLDAL